MVNNILNQQSGRRWLALMMLSAMISLTIITVSAMHRMDILFDPEEDEPTPRRLLIDQQRLMDILYFQRRQGEEAELADEKLSKFPTESKIATSTSSEVFILEDRDFPRSPFVDYPGVGQVSGVTVLPSGDVALFHRSEREWTENSFQDNEIIVDKSTIKNDTIMIIDGITGAPIGSLGADLFVMPHSIASDRRGYLWLSDTGRHQVIRMTADQTGNISRVNPDLALGEPYVPGSDLGHFCKPTEIVVSPDSSLIYVADGYCNKRILVFTGDGDLVGSFGDQFEMSVVHSLALLPDRNLICAADRENGRIICFHAGLYGELSHLGKHRLTLDYPVGKVYALVALGRDQLLVSSCSDNPPDNSTAAAVAAAAAATTTTTKVNNNNNADRQTIKRFRCDLAALNPFERQIKQVWASSDLTMPHALAISPDRRFVFAVELAKSSHKKLYKFEVIIRPASTYRPLEDQD